jgi:hypothetical protein
MEMNDFFFGETKAVLLIAGLLFSLVLAYGITLLSNRGKLKSPFLIHLSCQLALAAAGLVVVFGM